MVRVKRHFKHASSGYIMPNGRAIAYSALSIMLSSANNEEI